MRAKRLRRSETIRFAGLDLTRPVARWLAKRARSENRSLNSIITEILEGWARRRYALESGG